MPLLCAASLLAYLYPAYGHEQKRELRCAEGTVKLTEYADSELYRSGGGGRLVMLGRPSEDMTLGLALRSYGECRSRF
jgi:hypothetical protein